ncbi:MAG: hypothetical protein ACTSQA_08570 [Candidatus Heimdallarchaeaceae archaeon]
MSIHYDKELMRNEKIPSPYLADDSDDLNEQSNYWRSWEQAERLASATYCDFQLSCWECASIFGHPDEEEISPCEKADTDIWLEHLEFRTSLSICPICGLTGYFIVLCSEHVKEFHQLSRVVENESDIERFMYILDRMSNKTVKRSERII